MAAAATTATVASTTAATLTTEIAMVMKLIPWPMKTLIQQEMKILLPEVMKTCLNFNAHVLGVGVLHLPHVSPNNKERSFVRACVRCQASVANLEQPHLAKIGSEFRQIWPIRVKFTKFNKRPQSQIIPNTLRIHNKI